MRDITTQSASKYEQLMIAGTELEIRQFRRICCDRHFKQQDILWIVYGKSCEYNRLAMQSMLPTEVYTRWNAIEGSDKLEVRHYLETHLRKINKHYRGQK